MNMRLLGARNLSEIVPEMVDASALRAHAGLTPPDNLYNATCKTPLQFSIAALTKNFLLDQPLSLASFKTKL